MVVYEVSWRCFSCHLLIGWEVRYKTFMLQLLIVIVTQPAFLLGSDFELSQWKHSDPHQALEKFDMVTRAKSKRTEFELRSIICLFGGGGCLVFFPLLVKNWHPSLSAYCCAFPLSYLWLSTFNISRLQDDLKNKIKKAIKTVKNSYLY